MGVLTEIPNRGLGRILQDDVNHQFAGKCEYLPSRSNAGQDVTSGALSRDFRRIPLERFAPVGEAFVLYLVVYPILERRL